MARPVNAEVTQTDGPNTVAGTIIKIAGTMPPANRNPTAYPTPTTMVTSIRPVSAAGRPVSTAEGAMGIDRSRSITLSSAPAPARSRYRRSRT